jgi:hypothetical protein
MAHTCNPIYLGGWDWEDGGLRPALENSSQDPNSNITRTKVTEGVAQEVECLLCKCEAVSWNPSPIKKKKDHLMKFPQKVKNGVSSF